MRSFFIFCLILFSGCASKNIQHGFIKKNDTIIGQNRQTVIKNLGGEFLQSNIENCIYYISQNGKSFYFLHPRNMNYDVKKICFTGDNVESINNSQYKVKFNSKFSKKLKSQDKITAQDFFKEMIGTSNFIPGK